MDNLLLEPDARDTAQLETTQDHQDDGEDLLAWLSKDNLNDPFADRRFII